MLDKALADIGLKGLAFEPTIEKIRQPQTWTHKKMTTHTISLTLSDSQMKKLSKKLKTEEVTKENLIYFLLANAMDEIAAISNVQKLH